MVTRSQTLRRQIGAWSASLGFQVLTADNARQALRIKNRQRPVVAVMSELGTSRATLALARHMRARESALSLPPSTLLAASLTGFAEPYEAVRSAGFSGVLSSPPTYDGLRARLGAAGLLMGSEAQKAVAQRRDAEALFWTELDSDLGELEQSIARLDTSDARRWAHRIKGASLMFGQEALGEAAAALEAWLSNSSQHDVAALAEAAVQFERLVMLFHAQRSNWHRLTPGS